MEEDVVVVAMGYWGGEGEVTEVMFVALVCSTVIILCFYGCGGVAAYVGKKESSDSV